MGLISPQKCPRCSAQLAVIKRWFGLRGTLPTSCPQCGAGLVYDSAGEVTVRPASTS